MFFNPTLLVYNIPISNKNGQCKQNSVQQGYLPEITLQGEISSLRFPKYRFKCPVRRVYYYKLYTVDTGGDQSPTFQGQYILLLDPVK